MSIIRFFRNLFRPSNIGIFVFFFLNACVITSIFSGGDPEKVKTIVIVYLFSILISMSPIGELFISYLAGARMIQDPYTRDRLSSLVQNVYDKAREKTPSLPSNIIIKMSNEPLANAFAFGRKTICVTEGLMSLRDEEIEGMLAHEFGRLALHHPLIQLVMGTGNVIIMLFLVTLNFIRVLVTAIASRGGCLSRSCLVQVFCAVIGGICSAITWIWIKYCMLCFMWSSRANEYAADKYAFEIGYGSELASALRSIGFELPRDSFIQTLYSSFPSVDDRIGKLREMDADV